MNRINGISNEGLLRLKAQQGWEPGDRVDEYSDEEWARVQKGEAPFLNETLGLAVEDLSWKVERLPSEDQDLYQSIMYRYDIRTGPGETISGLVDSLPEKEKSQFRQDIAMAFGDIVPDLKNR